MKLLAVDIGTGTQDIVLFDTQLDIENSFKLILPSPTMRIFRKIKQATHDRVDILLSGYLMGGGPSTWAVKDHIRAGLKVYATLPAGCTFDDDPEVVRGMGVIVISEDELTSLPAQVRRIHMCDFDYEEISRVFVDFGVDLNDLAAVAVGVFDHGNAPAGVSDRKFRFDYLDARIRAKNHLSVFAYPADQIPASMTRLQAVAASACNVPAPLVVMDTAAAAILGATYDAKVQMLTHKIVVNIGNLHTLAFRLDETAITGMFEHHTGMLSQEQLERLLIKLADGTLTNAEIFEQHGHGALIYASDSANLESDNLNLVVTGPRRNKLANSRLNPYFAVPFGDMMITGCIGLLAATAESLPDLASPICASLDGTSVAKRAPWEVD